MATLTDGIKDLVRPPFANYDVVVYFGCGLFSLPFLFHYIASPKEAGFLALEVATGVPFADSAIKTLFALFAVYILGHLLAFLSSLFVEKTAELLLGKMSDASILGHRRRDQQSFDEIKDWVKRRWKLAWRKGSRARSLIRLLFFFPVSFSFVLAYAIKWFGYFTSRIPEAVYERVKTRLQNKRLPTPGHTKDWYKATEHYVIANDPTAVPRMYNYLVIGGLFRSLTFLFACCAWMEFARLVGAFYQDTFPTDAISDWQPIVKVAMYNLLFAFSFASYVKFSRRYAEEMLFSFALRRP
ncbi:hypothetical protein LZ518_08615 [Sphingomonas sp. RB56-2]|uniref:Uncharacterized protein n=1 Tax=Sphingomonas brevis TaxID=2908206 RepID=A0ABT0S9V4_9SPHN|nr:hypothetical protein [Sphingomonas brevis]MCL6741191.1 hypothetical protein [Sphingomonas brevis]